MRNTSTLNRLRIAFMALTIFGAVYANALADLPQYQGNETHSSYDPNYKAY